MQLKSILEYKKIFIISCITQIATSIFAVFSILFLFQKFGSINGYTFDNVLICFSISYLGYSIAECFFRAFDQFDNMLGNGEFDRILVRPRSLILQVLGSKMQFEKFGRAGAALVIFIWVLIKNPEFITVEKLTTLIFMIVGTVIIYDALFILKAGITFFTTQSLEIMNIFTDGARDLAQYPLDIYQKWVKTFFTYILPLALVNYYPLLYVIGKSDNKIFILFPLLSILFLVPCKMVWKIGIKKYKSTGS
jgi:ABC-2 type transport system permease protein